MRNVLFSIFVLFTLSASAGEAQDALDHMALIDDFAYEAPTFLKGKNSEAQIRSIGKVLKEEHTKEPNPGQEGTQIFVKTLHFQGLDIRFFQAAPNYEPMRVYVWVKSSKWPIKQGLNVGVPAAKVLQALGDRATKKADSLEYSGETEHVTFIIKNNVVTEVHFDYYTG